LFAHDLFGKPLHTFPDHALATMMAMASRRRTAMVTFSTRTAIGSPPTMPSCRISTRAPSTKPSSISRLSSSTSGSVQRLSGGEALDHAGIAAPGQAERHRLPCSIGFAVNFDHGF
jgi:hypothetical protein